jgi:hypothetical protein
VHRVLTALACFLVSALSTAQNRGVFVTPIPDAPLLAVVDTQSALILKDGTTSNQKTLSAIARDRQGRIFNERRSMVPASDTEAPPILSIHIYDPQTRTNTFIDPRQKVAWQNTLNRPPSTAPPDKRSAPSSAYVKEEDLGTRRMEGVECHGIRDTQTIPADEGGNGKEVVVVDEYWYSDELRLNMLVIHRDPRTGEQTTTVTQVSRSDPDPAIFAVPSGYQIIQP